MIFRRITNSSDISLLQDDLNRLFDWCATWSIELNINKCKSMQVSRTNSTCPTYMLNDSPLQSVASYRYLGLLVTRYFLESTD